MPIISIVFEDEGNTFSENNLILKRFRRKQIKVTEFVYSIHGNSQYIGDLEINYIIESLKKINGGTYVDTTGKSSPSILRTSRNPSNSSDSENSNNIKLENRIHMKRTVHLKESELKQMIKESIRSVMNEASRSYKWTRELEEALYNIQGMLGEVESEGHIDKNLLEELSDATHKVIRFINKETYDDGPYEGEPYYFGY